jgi:multidrug transporter EmrE-like cation transporter
MLRQFLQVIPVLFFSYVGQVLMKRGVQSAGDLDLRLILSKPSSLMTVILDANTVLGFISAGIGAIFYLFVLARTDLTVALPILGALGFLLLPLIGYLFLGESFGFQRIVGTIVIAVGMLIVARS